MTSIWTWLDGRDTARMARYRELLAFYEGQQWDERRRAGETRLTVNYARTLIRKAASYLMPQPVLFDVLALSSGFESTGKRDAVQVAEQALARVYAANDLATVDFQSAVDSAVLGDGAFKVSWDQDAGQPAVVAVDPQSLWAWRRADNPRVVERVVQRYETENRKQAPGASGAGTRTKIIEDWTADRFRMVVDGEIVRDGENPYGWIPYVIYPNLARPHEFWGSSDLEDLIEICRELNRRMTTISRVLQVAGYPITVLENVTGSEGIRIDAGAVWELPEDSKAYLLDMLQGGGLRLHVDYIDLLYRQLHDLSETPRTAFGDSGRSLSGVALEVEIQPLVQKVMRKRRTWDGVYRQRNRLILDLLERFGDLDIDGLRETRAIWGEVLPSDRHALVRSEARLVESNIHSRREAMANLGDADAEATWQRILEELGAREQAVDKRE